MKKRRRITQCPNCLTQLNRQENFCPSCGQENHFHNNSMKELWDDFIGSLWNFDGKIWTTLSTLFLKPGKVPKEYVQGKKAKYVPPIRLYLFVSFAYFLVMNFGMDMILNSESLNSIYEIKPSNMINQKVNISKDVYKEHENDNQAVLIKVAEQNASKEIQQKIQSWHSLEAIDSVTISESKNLSISIKIRFDDDLKKEVLEDNYVISFFLKPQYDSLVVNGKLFAKSDIKKVYNDPSYVQTLINNSKSSSWFDKVIKTNTVQYLSVFYFGKAKDRKEFLSKKIRTWLSYLSYAMFLIMPISAFLLFMFYFRRYNYYYPHFVLTLNLHTYIFLTFAIVLGILTVLYKTLNYVNPIILNLSILLLASYQTYYFTRTLKNFYQKTWLKATIASFIVSIIYLIILYVIFLALVVLIFIIN